MKRALSIFGVIGVTALITYLAITRQMAQERAARLDRALMDAEARVIQLEADIDAAKQRLTELTEARQRVRPPAPPPRKAPVIAPTAAPMAPLTANGLTTGASPSEGAGVVVTVAPVPVTGSLVRYAAFTRPGLTNFVRIEGTSTIHDWQVESRLIGGSAELGSGLPTRPKVKARPGPVDARINVFIPVRSLKSVEKDGSPYSDPMDEIMYDKLREENNKRITYTLTSLTLKEKSREMTDPYQYEATGNLTVAGETNVITMPVAVSLDPSGRIQFAGSVKVKMTDFKITPPSPSFGGVSIKTGDEVTLSFAWWVNRADTKQAAR
jgi:type II secretory pathway pseudopilin PulG